MSVLTMNLRHLYQRRGLWLAYLMFAFFVWIGVMVALDDPTAGRGAFIGLIVLAFLIGMMAAVLQMEILSKPMSFCLPRHRQNLRGFIFTVGIAVNLLAALLFLFYPGLSVLRRPVVVGSAFSAGLVFYLAGVLVAFRARQPLGFVGLIAFVTLSGRLAGLHILLERLVVQYPAVTAGLGLLCAVMVWRHLDNVELARRHCVQPWVGLVDVFDREKLRRSPWAREAAPWAKLKDHPRPWVEDFFLARVRRCRPLSAGRFVWGAMYGSFAVTLSQWPHIFSLLAAVTVLLGYISLPLIVIMFAAVPIVAGTMQTSDSVLYSALLTAGGRRERFYATLAVATAGTTLIVLFLGGVVALSVLLVPLMPELRWGQFDVAYRAIDARVLYGPLFLLPVAGMIHLVLYRRPVLFTIVLMGLLYVVVMVGHTWQRELRPLANAPAAALLAACCWLAFTAIVHLLATRRCLGR